jgi:hypothetical protein
MRLLFVNWAYDNHGSAQDLFHYTRVARSMGHEVTLYGQPDGTAFNYSLDVASADAVIFIFEFTTRLTHGEAMGFCRMIGGIPRRKRIVIDCDGKYNDAISVGGDVNHPDAAASRRWCEICDSLSDTILQPTHRPARKNVRPFFFHAYDPSWEIPLDAEEKRDFGMVYVGNNWFRWRALRRVLDAVTPVREKIGRMGIVGSGWDAVPEVTDPAVPEDAYHTEPQYLRSLGVETIPPVKFDQVIPWMGRGVFSPVVYRPLFDHLRLVTCRTFETPAANTIPLFCQEPDFVEEIYGPVASEMVLPRENPHEKVLDLFARRAHYAEAAKELRHELARRYSYRQRLKELVEMVQG